MMIRSNGKKILQLALPLILQQLCLQMQLWIDPAMLGPVNAAYFSAIGNASMPYHMVLSTITAVCGGTAILTAQSIGAGDRNRVKEVAESSFLGSSVLSLLAFGFFLFFSDELFALMGVQPPILEFSLSYIRILSVSLIFMGISSTATGILQGLGFTKVIMAAGIAGNLLNILLDRVLIFGVPGIPAMGISGAALATVIANFLSALVLFVYVLRSSRMPVALRMPRDMGASLRQYRQVLKLGIPSGLEYALWNVGNVILVSFLNRVDAMAAGIYTLVFSVETVPLLIYMGFANAGLTLVGQQTGANDPRQAKRTGLTCLTFSLVICLVVAVIFRAFPRQILLCFTDDVSILDVSVPHLVFVSWILFPKAVNNVIGLCIRGMGDTRWMLYTQIFGSAVMILGGYLLILHFGLGLSGIFITLLADEGLRGIANLLRFLWGRSS